MQKKRYPEINFYASNFESFFDKCSKYDLTILSDIVEHVEDDLLLLKKTAKVSKYILLNLPLEKCEEYENRKYGPKDHEGHLRAYSYEDAEKLVKSAGLNIEKYIVKRYVDQPIFRKYLLNKVISNHGKNVEAIIKYLEELNHIEVNVNYYKSNLFALLVKNR